MTLNFLQATSKRRPREGSLLPETYDFPRGFSRQAALARMEKAQTKIVDEIWKKRAPDLPIKSPGEMVTLASIVEKETGKADERPRVAGVFVNRLQKHMRLEVRPDDRLRARVRQGHARALRSPGPISIRPRPTTPTSSTACLQGPFPIPARPRWRRSPILSAARICISWPTEPEATSSPIRSSST